MCCPGGNSDFYPISLSALKKTGLRKWQNQIEFIFTALESMGFIVSSGLISLSSSSFFLLPSFSSIFFLFFSFFLLILSSGFITRQLIEKVDMREGTLSVCGLFSFCASKQTIHLYLPCPVPWEAGLYGKLLVVSLALWFPGFNLREAPAGGERAE